MPVIGISGFPASGKTTLCKKLSKKFHCQFINPDTIVEKLYRPGEKGNALIKKFFGNEFLNKKGTINKCKLRKKILRDQNFKKQLETVIHPLVIDLINLRINRERNIILEIPSIIENPLYELADYIFFIKTDMTEIKKRLKKRGLDAEEINFLLDNQKRTGLEINPMLKSDLKQIEKHLL